jgi:hypothetical protein
MSMARLKMPPCPELSAFSPRPGQAQLAVDKRTNDNFLIVPLAAAGTDAPSTAEQRGNGIDKIFATNGSYSLVASSTTADTGVSEPRDQVVAERAAC